MFKLFNISKENPLLEDNLVDEKENKALVFILIMVVVGLFGIVIFVYQDYLSKVNAAFSLLATLFFLAGAIFTFSNLIGFLFGIPRTTIIDESEKSKSQYIGNDNLLQLSDWLTKIILGVGLTQINEIPNLLQRISQFIMNNSEGSNQAIIILIILYFGCIGFLFGYLWTRLYFIKMLRDSDNDVNNDAAISQIKTQITTNINTDISTSEEM